MNTFTGNNNNAIPFSNTLPGGTASVNNAEHRLLSGAELAAYIGMSKKFVSKHTEAGRLPGVVRIGRYLRYDRAIIDKRLAGGKLLFDKDERF